MENMVIQKREITFFFTEFKNIMGKKYHFFLPKLCWRTLCQRWKPSNNAPCNTMCNTMCNTTYNTPCNAPCNALCNAPCNILRKPLPTFLWHYRIHPRHTHSYIHLRHPRSPWYTTLRCKHLRWPLQCLQFNHATLPSNQHILQYHPRCNQHIFQYHPHYTRGTRLPPIQW